MVATVALMPLLQWKHSLQFVRWSHSSWRRGGRPLTVKAAIAPWLSWPGVSSCRECHSIDSIKDENQAATSEQQTQGCECIEWCRWPMHYLKVANELNSNFHHDGRHCENYKVVSLSVTAMVAMVAVVTILAMLTLVIIVAMLAMVAMVAMMQLLQWTQSLQFVRWSHSWWRRGGHKTWLRLTVTAAIASWFRDPVC